MKFLHKKSICFFVIVFSSNNISTETGAHQGPPVYITNHFSNDSHANTHSVSQASSSATTETITTVRFKQQLKNLQSTATQMLDETRQKAPAYIDTLSSHKCKIILAMIGSGYIYTLYIFHATNTIIKDRHSWCNWKQHVDLPDLISTPYQELIPQLLKDIQKKYFLQEQPLTKKEANSKIPFELFMQDLYKEQIALKQYSSMQKIIKKLCLSTLFYTCYDHEIVQQKINRLQIILDIFATWQTNDLLR